MTNASVVRIGSNFDVSRLGFGAMRLTGPGNWGWPSDPDECVDLLRHALDAGIEYFDTASAYGPYVSELLIARALHPYPPSVVIGTKCGLVHNGPGDFAPDGRPEAIRRSCEESLERLAMDELHLLHLHRPDPDVPLVESVGALAELKAAGKVREIGVSNVSPQQLRELARLFPISTVQNRLSVRDRDEEPVLHVAAELGIAFIPWGPLGFYGVIESELVRKVAGRRGITPVQLMLAWILSLSAVTLPIPGMVSRAQLSENVGSVSVRLDDAEMKELEDVPLAG